MSRTTQSLKSAASGIGLVVSRMASRFIIQTAFIYYLGANYVGLQGFLRNVVGFLNITELGIGTAIVYSLYKVLADNDTLYTAAIMRLFKKLYMYIGIIVLGISGIVALCMPSLVKNLSEFPDFWSVYGLYIVDTLLTYWFFSYRNAILQADQRQYVINLINICVQVVTTVVQVGAIYITKSFSLFLLAGICVKIIGNIYLKYRTDKMYPYLLIRQLPAVPAEVVASIKTNVKAIFIYNAGFRINVVLDTMLISYYLDIVTVGKYSVYILVFNAFNSLSTAFFSAFTASVGNLHIKDSPEKNEHIFRCLNLVNFFAAGVAGIVVAACMGDFILLWAGPAYLFDPVTHYFLIFNFFSDLLGNVVQQFRNAYGLFDQGKYRPMAGAVLNAALSMYFAPKYGVIGIVMGTIISSYLTFWWFDSWLVYHYGFKKSVFGYYRNYLIDMAYITVGGAAMAYAGAVLIPAHGIIAFLAKGCAVTIIAAAFMFLRYHHKKEMVFLRSRFQAIVSKKFR